jgi:hypothetical protein
VQAFLLALYKVKNRGVLTTMASSGKATRSAADVVTSAALADSSFAGPFAYYTNSPAKVFAGEMRPVPLEVMVEALEEMQAGHGAGQHAAAMHGVLKSQDGACEQACSKKFQQCADSHPGDYGVCVQQLAQCIPTCL